MDDFIKQHFIPLLSTSINSSDNELALEALRAAKALIDYYPLDDLVQSLDNALMNKNKDVAHLALDILRMKRSSDSVSSIAPAEYKKLLLDIVLPFLFTSFIPQIEKPPEQREDAIQNKIANILDRNPTYVNRLKEIKSKYRIE